MDERVATWACALKSGVRERQVHFLALSAKTYRHVVAAGELLNRSLATCNWVQRVRGYGRFDMADETRTRTTFPALLSHQVAKLGRPVT